MHQIVSDHTISLPPVNINHKNDKKRCWETGVFFLSTYSKNGGTDLLQVGTQEALFHMHFYIRPVTTIKSTQPFIIALPLPLSHWSYLKCSCYKTEHGVFGELY